MDASNKDDSRDSDWSTAANCDSFETRDGDSTNCALDPPSANATERPNSPTEERPDVSETPSTESSMDESSGSEEVDAGEVSELLQAASRSPDPGVLIALRDSLNVFDGEQTPPGSESDDGQMDTNETTWRRLARYAAEANTHSNDKTWEELNESDQYFTGSADTSGGCISDGSEYPMDGNDNEQIA